MLEKIIEYLKKQNWIYTKQENVNNVFFPLSGFNGLYQCLVIVVDETSLFSFITYLGRNCPVEKQSEMVKLINRINANLLYGNFEMNPNGDIKYRTAICYEGLEVTDTAIESIMFRNLHNMDFSSPFITKFMHGTLTEDEVFANFFPPKNLEDKEHPPLPDAIEEISIE